MGSVFDDNSSIFSFHSGASSGNNASTTTINNYGAADRDSGIEVRRTSISVETPNHANIVNEAFRQSPASIARNSKAEPELDGLITGNPPPVPPDLSVLDSNVPPQEIEPPSFDVIFKYKVRQLEKPNIFQKAFRAISGDSTFKKPPQIDENVLCFSNN